MLAWGGFHGLRNGKPHKTDWLDILIGAVLAASIWAVWEVLR